VGARQRLSAAYFDVWIAREKDNLPPVIQSTVFCINKFCELEVRKKWHYGELQKREFMRVTSASHDDKNIFIIFTMNNKPWKKSENISNPTRFCMVKAKG